MVVRVMLSMNKQEFAEDKWFVYRIQYLDFTYWAIISADDIINIYFWFIPFAG